MFDRDIWTAAEFCIGRYGDDAPLEAGKRARQLLADGDPDGQAVWLRIRSAIEELQRRDRYDGEAVH